MLDVERDPHGAQRLALGVALHHAAPGVHPAPCAVEAHDLVLRLHHAVATGGEAGVHRVGHVGRLVGVHAGQKSVNAHLHRGLGAAHDAQHVVAVGDVVGPHVKVPEPELCRFGCHAVALVVERGGGGRAGRVGGVHRVRGRGGCEVRQMGWAILPSWRGVHGRWRLGLPLRPLTCASHLPPPAATSDRQPFESAWPPPPTPSATWPGNLT